MEISRTLEWAAGRKHGVLITNRKDEANLRRPDYRAKLVERLARAIVAYLVEYGPQR